MNVIEILNYEINLNFIFRKIVIDCSVIVANAQMTSAKEARQAYWSIETHSLLRRRMNILKKQIKNLRSQRLSSIGQL
jgi:hypothetical protein